MQKYYCMIKYNTEYPEKETKRIYRYVHYRNQQNEKKYNQAKEKGYSGEEFLDKIVSEDIFQKYGYLFNKSDSENVDNAVSNNNWGEPVPMEHDFSIKEMLDMPTEGEVLSEPILTNMDCVRYNDLCKNESHGRKFDRELFCVTRKDSDYIDIEDLY